MKKIERLLTIVFALKQSGRLTAAKLAEKLDVNIRTIYRDIDALSQMEVPIASEPGANGGYSIGNDYFLPALSFSEDELLALKLGHKLLDEVQLPGFNAEIESAFLKIDSAAGGAEGKSAVLDSIIFDLAGTVPEIKNLRQFDKIRHALSGRYCIEISYFSPNRMEERIRQVEPWILKFYNGCWYLTGHCRSSEDTRTFRLDRIRSISLTENRFDYPDNFNPADYDRNTNYLRDVLKPGDGTGIVLKIRKALYQRDKELLLLKYYDYEETDQQWGKILINTNYPEDFVEYAVKHFPDAVIDSPDELRTELKEKLKKIIDHY